MKSDATIHKSMHICMVLQPDVYHIQNAGYTRGRTYITETDLEIYTSRPSTLFKFIRGCQFHPINLQTTQDIELGTRFSEVMNTASEDTSHSDTTSDTSSDSDTLESNYSDESDVDSQSSEENDSSDTRDSNSGDCDRWLTRISSKSVRPHPFWSVLVGGADVTLDSESRKNKSIMKNHQ